MQLKSEILKQRLADLAQFEHLFASNNSAEFNERLGDKSKGFIHYMGRQAAEKTKSVFEDFDFAQENPRFKATQDAFRHLGYLTGPEKFGAMITKNKAFNFLQEAISQIQNFFKNIDLQKKVEEEKTKQPAAMQALIIGLQYLSSGYEFATQIEQEKYNLLQSMRTLIGLQKDSLQSDLDLALQKEAQAKANTKTALLKKYAFYTGTSLAAAAGVSVSVSAALMQYNPHFAMLVGLHFTPAVLASIAVTGLVVAITAAYALYRSYKPAPTQTTEHAAEANKGYSKLLTASILTSGFSLAAFTALVQFSPNLLSFSPHFALLIGLHLSPATLIGMAVVSTLLLSIGLYRMCKANAQTPAPAANDAPAAETKTCMQRAYEYAASFRSLFKSAPAEVTAPENNNNNNKTVTTANA